MTRRGGSPHRGCTRPPETGDLWQMTVHGQLSSHSSLTSLKIGGFAGHIQDMTLRRFLTIFWVLLLALAVSGCTSCGWIWQDWLDSPQKSCRDRVPEEK